MLFFSEYQHRQDIHNVIINKLREKQCRRYVQPLNKVKFKFSSTPPTTTIVRRAIFQSQSRAILLAIDTQSLANQLVSSVSANIPCIY